MKNLDDTKKKIKSSIILTAQRKPLLMLSLFFFFKKCEQNKIRVLLINDIYDGHICLSVYYKYIIYIPCMCHYHCSQYFLPVNNAGI